MAENGNQNTNPASSNNPVQDQNQGQNQGQNQNLGSAQTQGNTQASGKSYTQEQLNAMMATEKRTARQALLKELGFTVEDDKSFKDTMAGIKQTLDASKTQAQKDAEARKMAEEAKAAAEAKANQLTMKVSLLSAGVQAQYLDDVITIASSKVNETNPIEKVIEDLKQRYPMFFSVSSASSSGTGSGNNPPKKNQPGAESLGKQLAQVNKQVHKSTYFKNT